ncbi:hypothetical protein J437_LFUL011947 [Ladona fulva]|uniref:Uncharacterized protein n=1 Tax=Ladona fulva TaxID=123851 RepID=A0A8K0NVQ3_LADFU|nr:hypothetical protein J437_LFUL011947 [Ladona fulva]
MGGRGGRYGNGGCGNVGDASCTSGAALSGHHASVLLKLLHLHFGHFRVLHEFLECIPENIPPGPPAPPSPPAPGPRSPAPGPPGPPALSLAVWRIISHLAQSTALGLPVMCSGQTPMVVPVRKLGGGGGGPSGGGGGGSGG